jgi:hypothetical protein
VCLCPDLGRVEAGLHHRDPRHRAPLAAAPLSRALGQTLREPPVGRPSVNAEIIALVRKMAAANPLWGAPRIHGELLKLGIRGAECTVSRLIPKQRTPPPQAWRTFLTNHVRDLVSIFFTVPTAHLRVLFVLITSPTIGVGSSTSTSPSIPPRVGPVLRQKPGRPASG